jgi:hypothetical protein
MSDLSRRTFIRTSAATGGAVAAINDLNAAEPSSSQSDREYWISLLTRIADPVLTALGRRELKRTMPIEAPHGNAAERGEFTHLEAVGRLFAGIAPWLESGENSGKEGESRRKYSDLARQGIASIVDKSSPDFLNFNRGQQPLVDAAFLALAVLRAPNELWTKLDDKAKAGLIEALRSSRVIRPSFSNWLLFSAMVEAFLCFTGESWDAMRVDYAIRQHEQWYKGDGIYGDGPQLHCDYYDSFVIHPMLLEVVSTLSKGTNAWETFQAGILARAQRYAAIQERFIGPDGSFPPVGRSISYRFGAFHLLATMALRRQLPDIIKPEQVRCGLTAVIRRMAEARDTFDERGWLRVGFCGHQPSVAEPYISTGSLYLCSVAFLPLGLPTSDPFWSGSEQAWTSKRMWNGEDVPADHAI